MEITRTGNLIEGVFWLLIAAAFLIPLLNPKEKNRQFCLTGTLLFVVFGISDFVESRTGAWWRPWWLLVWKAGCNVGFVIMGFWYVKIHGSIRAAIRQINKTKNDPEN